MSLMFGDMTAVGIYSYIIHVDKYLNTYKVCIQCTYIIYYIQ